MVMSRPSEEPPQGQPTGGHRPAPSRLRRASRTHWPWWKVGWWVALQLAVITAAVLVVLWLLYR